MTSQDESESEASAPVPEDEFKGSDAKLESLPSDERTQGNLWAFFALILHADVFGALFRFSPVFSVTAIPFPLLLTHPTLQPHPYGVYWEL